MRTSRTLFVAAMVMASFASVAPANAESLQHSVFMRGQIVDMRDDIATVCIGSADGARIGQVLDVARVVPVTIPAKSGPAFRRKDVGHVRIDSIVDTHFARATVIGGEAKVHDIVELRRE